MSDAPDDGDPALERGCYRKKRYSSAKLASKVAARCERERGVELRVYPCPTCGGFHLTKQIDPPPRR